MAPPPLQPADDVFGLEIFCYIILIILIMCFVYCLFVEHDRSWLQPLKARGYALNTVLTAFVMVLIRLPSPTLPNGECDHYILSPNVALFSVVAVGCAYML